MKSLKYLLLTGFILLGWGVINAQQGRSNAQRNLARAEMETFYDGLGLNKNQRTRLNTENERFAQERQGVRSQNKGQQKANREKMDALRQTHSQNMQGIMTKNQYSKFQTKQQGMREKHGQSQGKRKGQGKGQGNGQ
jgi:hypothetical protein